MDQQGPLVLLTEQGRREPIVMVHPIGGSVFGYRAFARAIEERHGIYAFEAPGLDGESEALASVEALALLYVQALCRVVPPPYRLLGFSFGGLVAFEMAHQLRKARQDIQGVVLVDCHGLDHAPHPPDEAESLAEFAQDLGRFAGKKVELDPLPLHALTRRRRFELLLSKLRECGVLGSEVSLHEIQSRYEVFHASLRALHAYVPRPLDLPMVHFRAAAAKEESDASLGWERLALSGLQIDRVEGDHYRLWDAPRALNLADKVAAFFRSSRG